MRLTQLRSFYAVARMGSFTKAAEHLHVSQPTITTQVRFLEEAYKVELFHRSGRRVQLTQLGEQLMQLAQQIFSLEADAVSLLGDAGELRTGLLRVAAVGPFHVTQMLADFSQHYPDIKVSVSTGNSQDVLDRLLDYRADVGVLAQLVKNELGHKYHWAVPDYLQIAHAAYTLVPGWLQQRGRRLRHLPLQLHPGHPGQRSGERLRHRRDRRPACADLQLRHHQRHDRRPE